MPDSRLLNEHFLLGEILDHIELFKEHFPKVHIFELIEQINAIRNHQVDPENHLRAFLNIFWDTGVFANAFQELDENTKRQLESFTKGSPHTDWLNVLHSPKDGEVEKSSFQIQPSPAVKHHFTELADVVHDFFHPHEAAQAKEKLITKQVVAEDVAKLPIIWEDEAKTKKMEVHAQAPFSNWGLSVNNVPVYTFVPTTVLGLSNLVIYAKSLNLRVRVGGYRHSWSSTFSQEDQIFISLLNLEEVTKIPDPMSISAEYIDPKNELKVIQVLDKGTWGEMMTESEGKGLVRVGVSVTNEQFRRWAVKYDKWSFPMDVILVE